jgi:hypothetical protein
MRVTASLVFQHMPICREIKCASQDHKEMNSSDNFVRSMYHLFNGYIYKHMYLRYAQNPSKHLVLI